MKNALYFLADFTFFSCTTEKNSVVHRTFHNLHAKYNGYFNANEVFIATTAGGPVPVTRVNENIFGNDTIGPITAKILQTYWDWHKREDLALKVCYHIV